MHFVRKHFVNRRVTLDPEGHGERRRKLPAGGGALILLKKRLHSALKNSPERTKRGEKFFHWLRNA